MRLTVPLSHRAPPGGGYAEKGNQQKASIEASPCARRPNRPRLYCFALRTRSVFAICRCLAASSPCNPFLGCKSSTGSCAIVFCTRRENNRPQNNAPSGWRGGGCSCHAWPLSYGHRPSHPYNVGTEHVGSSPSRHCLHQARSAVRCRASRMKGELHPTKKRS